MTTFRSRLLLSFLGLAVFSAALVFGLSTSHSKRLVFERIQSNVLTIALDAASRIDAAEHELIRSEDDAAGDAYASVRDTLRAVRDRNRRDDLEVAFVYTFRQVSSDPDRFAYVVDAEEPGDDRSPVGELIEWDERGTPEDEPLRIGPAYVDELFATDSYGHWLTGYAPVRSADGEIVAMVGVDLRADDVLSELAGVTRRSLLALGCAVAAAAVLSLLLARLAARPIAQLAVAARSVGDGHLEARVPVRRDEFGVVGAAFNAMAQSLQERDALKGALSRFVSQEAAQRLIAENRLPQVGGERREVTVLIGDIANLSRLAETLPPAQLVELLNEYFERMVDIIFSHHGTIDRLLGDRLIAVFGAPLEDPEKERNAIRAAIAMRQEQARLNDKWQLRGDQQFRLGVGIHTGSALVGNIGSRGNVEFTAVGAPLEIASLVGGENATHRTDALVSEATMAAVRDEFRFTEVGDVQPGESGDFIRIYAVREAAVAAG